ncbi:penicillin-binding transpeptidase domain-containing protein [Filimonas lacunae]|nr:penicillin-binding transpeptidase domain-containing protein [Filimonas lacunae]BAV09215.1 beta-lactamase [Filimonas lacunae]
MKQFLGLAVLSVMVGMYSCTPNNVTIENSWEKYFDSSKVTGTFGLYDNGQGKFFVYNLSRFKDSTYLPGSTFKILNSLIGLEKGTISNKKMALPWDKVVRKYPNGDTATGWNKDLTMEEAFKASAVPYFQEIARRIGRDTMQRWLDSLGYGSRYKKSAITAANLDTFWLDNSVKVTADEQLGLVKKLYFGQLPFHKKTTQEVVKDLLIQENNANYTLAYKTGWAFNESGKAIGWLVGWVEENRHPYFFAMNVEGPANTNMTQVREYLLKSILKQMGFLEGKK